MRCSLPSAAGCSSDARCHAPTNSFFGEPPAPSAIDPTNVQPATAASLIFRSFLRTQERLDRAAFVHRAVALCHLLDGQGQVEDLPGVDLPVPRPHDAQRGADRFRQAPARRGWAGARAGARRAQRGRCPARRGGRPPAALGAAVGTPIRHRTRAASVPRAQSRIDVEIAVEDRLVDIVREGYDAGVRVPESSERALGEGGVTERYMLQVGLPEPFRYVVVGAPSYVAQRGTPERPEDLLRHECITFRSQT